MTPERYKRVKEIFQAAVEQEPALQASMIVEACGGDDVLLREVQSLLACQDAAENFIEKSAFEVGARLISKDGFESLEGRLIGQYKLLGEIGQGGMGVVYRGARADEQYEKIVAVKLLRRGLDTEEMRRRFAHERQILAKIDHPNIARLIDAGTTEDGWPYLVMDYVEGVVITRYCDEHRLSTSARLKLFLSVCSAVAYAHQNLVIHRDIKPANVLVTAEGIPKLLDFGIAKLLNTETDEQGSTVTQLGAMTPEYASPEQVRCEQVTTATDVYSLGVLLYELLTGHRPYRIKSRRPDEIVRVICEKEPTRPSLAATSTEVISSDGNGQGRTITPEEVSRSRDVSPERLKRSLSGDLDNIVLMALRKEPQRRYASVAQLTDDIQRHIDGLPVAARVDTIWYRSSKFVKRHKVGVAAAAVVLIALAAGLSVALWQARVAAKQRDQAQIQQAKAEHINAFMQEMLSSADPARKGRDVRVAEVLDEATLSMEARLADQPAVLTEVRRTIGNTYRSLGLYDKAEPQLRAAFEMNKKLFGERNPATVKSMSDLAYLLRFKGNWKESDALFRRSLEIQRETNPEGSREMAETLILFAETLLQQGQTKSSEPFAQQALEMSNKFLGEQNEIGARALNSLGLIRDYEGNLNGAELNYRKAIEIHRRLPGRPRFELAATLMNLGTNLSTQGKYDDSERAMVESVQIFRDVLGDSHALYGMSLVHLGRLNFLKTDYAKAEKVTRQAIAIQERSLPKGHFDFSQSYSMLGVVLTRAGKAKEAEPYLRQSIEIRKKSLPTGHWLIANTISCLGECMTAQRRYEEAEPMLKEGYEGLKTALGEKHPRTGEAIQRLVQFYEATKNSAETARYRQLMPTK